MRIFLAILILIFSLQSWTKADDIRDFEIEGMSIGDSLKNYMDINLIKEALNNEFAFYYKKDFVTISTWEIRDKYKIYDDVGVVLNRNDKKYKIYALEGILYFQDKDIDKCHKKQIEITDSIKNSLDLSTEGNTFFIPKDRLKKHQKSIKYIDFELSEGGVIRTSCLEVKKGVAKNVDYHLLHVIVNSSLFWKYISK